MKFIALILLSLSGLAQDTSTVLNGSSSKNSTSYHWRQLTGVVASLQAPDSVVCRVTSLTVGTRQFELSCTNQFGVDRDTVQITVTSIIYSAKITNTKINTFLWIDKLTWSASNVRNVAYFLIEKGTWSKVISIISRGNTSYTYTVNRPWFSSIPKYRVTPVFINGKSGTSVKFN